MFVPDLLGPSVPGRKDLEPNTKGPQDKGEFASMLESKSQHSPGDDHVVKDVAQARTEKVVDTKTEKDADTKMEKTVNAKAQKIVDAKTDIKEEQDAYADSLQARAVPQMTSALPMAAMPIGPVMMSVPNVLLTKGDMMSGLEMLQSPLLQSYQLQTPQLQSPQLQVPQLQMPQFQSLQSQQFSQFNEMENLIALQQAMLASQQFASTQVSAIPTDLSFSPRINNYVCDGLASMLMGADKAGVTDGKEVVNLINKMVSEFNLDKDKVTSEFDKVALMNPKQKAEFTLGQFFKNLGIEDKQLDKAYIVVSEVVARESIKASICKANQDPSNQLIANKDDRFDELMMSSSYLDRKSPVLMNQKVIAPYTGMTMGQMSGKNSNINMAQHSLAGTGTKFEDLMLQQGSSDTSAMYNAGIQSTRFQDFSTLKPVTHLTEDQVSNPAVLKDSLVTDAKLLVREGGGKMEITLHPDHMGKIEIKVDTQSNRVNLEVVCSNPQVKQMVESQMSDLKLAMTGSNLVTEKINVSLASNTSSGGNYNESSENYSSKQNFSEHARENWERHNNRRQNNRDHQFA